MSGVVDVGVKQPRKLTVLERLYIPEIVKGMGVTIRHLLRNIARIRTSRRSCTPKDGATTPIAFGASTS